MTIQPGSSPWDVGAASPAASGEPATMSAAGQLQQMLARAVEDQASEQRELTASIAGMRDQLARLGQEIADLRDRGPAADAPVADAPAGGLDAASVHQFLAASIAPILDRLDELAAATCAQSTSLAQLHARLGPIQTDLTAIGGNLQGIVDAPAPPDAVSLAASTTGEIHDLEHRLRAYIDESLVALAEIILRRRSAVQATPGGDTVPAGDTVLAGDTMPAADTVPAGDTVPAADTMPAADQVFSSGPAPDSPPAPAGLASETVLPADGGHRPAAPVMSTLLSGPTRPAPDTRWKPQTSTEPAAVGSRPDPEHSKRRWGRRR